MLYDVSENIKSNNLIDWLNLFCISIYDINSDIPCKSYFLHYFCGHANKSYFIMSFFNVMRKNKIRGTFKRQQNLPIFDFQQKFFTIDSYAYNEKESYPAVRIKRASNGIVCKIPIFNSILDALYGSCNANDEVKELATLTDETFHLLTDRLAEQSKLNEELLRFNEATKLQIEYLTEALMQTNMILENLSSIVDRLSNLYDWIVKTVEANAARNDYCTVMHLKYNTILGKVKNMILDENRRILLFVSEISLNEEGKKFAVSNIFNAKGILDQYQQLSSPKYYFNNDTFFSTSSIENKNNLAFFIPTFVSFKAENNFNCICTVSGFIPLVYKRNRAVGTSENVYANNVIDDNNDQAKLFTVLMDLPKFVKHGEKNYCLKRKKSYDAIICFVNEKSDRDKKKFDSSPTIRKNCYVFGMYVLKSLCHETRITLENNTSDILYVCHSSMFQIQYRYNYQAKSLTMYNCTEDEKLLYFPPNVVHALSDLNLEQKKCNDDNDIFQPFTLLKKGITLYAPFNYMYRVKSGVIVYDVCFDKNISIMAKEKLYYGKCMGGVNDEEYCETDNPNNLISLLDNEDSYKSYVEEQFVAMNSIFNDKYTASLLNTSSIYESANEIKDILDNSIFNYTTLTDFILINMKSDMDNIKIKQIEMVSKLKEFDEFVNYLNTNNSNDTTPFFGDLMNFVGDIFTLPFSIGKAVKCILGITFALITLFILIYIFVKIIFCLSRCRCKCNKKRSYTLRERNLYE